MPTIEGITFAEQPGSGTFTIRDGKFVGVREFKIAWDDKGAFLLALLGGVSVYGITRVTQRPQPFEEGSHFIALGADVEGFGTWTNDGTYITYREVLVKINYGIPDYDEKDDPDDPAVEPWIVLNFRSWTEQLVVPNYELEWASDNAPLPETISGGFPVCHGQLSIEAINAVDPDFEALDGVRGKVNSDTFLGFGAGTLLFGGYSKHQTVNVAGEYSGWTITAELAWRQYDWRYQYRPSTGVWEEVERADGNPLFAEAAFTNLIGDWRALED